MLRATTAIARQIALQHGRQTMPIARFTTRIPTAPRNIQTPSNDTLYRASQSKNTVEASTQGQARKKDRLDAIVQRFGFSCTYTRCKSAIENKQTVYSAIINFEGDALLNTSMIVQSLNKKFSFNDRVQHASKCARHLSPTKIEIPINAYSDEDIGNLETAVYETRLKCKIFGHAAKEPRSVEAQTWKNPIYKVLDRLNLPYSAKHFEPASIPGTRDVIVDFKGCDHLDPVEVADAINAYVPPYSGMVGLPCVRATCLSGTEISIPVSPYSQESLDNMERVLNELRQET